MSRPERGIKVTRFTSRVLSVPRHRHCRHAWPSIDAFLFLRHGTRTSCVNMYGYIQTSGNEKTEKREHEHENMGLGCARCLPAPASSITSPEIIFTVLHSSTERSLRADGSTTTASDDTTTRESRSSVRYASEVMTLQSWLKPLEAK